jgi:hypothetical protein
MGGMALHYLFFISYFSRARACVSIKYSPNLILPIRKRNQQGEGGENTLFFWPKIWKFLFLSGVFCKMGGKNNIKSYESSVNKLYSIENLQNCMRNNTTD